MRALRGAESRGRLMTPVYCSLCLDFEAEICPSACPFQPRELLLLLPLPSLLSVSYTCLSVRNHRSRRSPLRLRLFRLARCFLSICLPGREEPRELFHLLCFRFRFASLRSAEGHGPDDDEDVEEDEGDCCFHELSVFAIPYLQIYVLSGTCRDSCCCYWVG